MQDRLINNYKKGRQFLENILLQVKDLETIVNSKKVNFSAEKGDIICIFGLNGSGKSVLLKTLCGVIDKKQGSISYNIDKKQLGICLQFPEHLIFKETALAEAVLIMNNDETGAKNLLKEINASEDMSPFYLSDGQKRLLFIYGYLETKELIMLDEPFVSLDDNSKTKVAAKIKEAASIGKCIIYTANRAVDKDIAGKFIYV